MIVVRKHEGGDTGPGGLPNDPGGRTKYGYSLRQMKVEGWDVDGDGDVDEEDVAALTPELVSARYRVRFWNPINGDRLAAISQDIATKALDIAIHAGPGRAALIIQKSLNQLRRIRIPEDGKLGPLTLASIGACETIPLLLCMVTQQSAFYGACFEQDPAKEVFRKNWLTRAQWPFNEKKK